MFVYVSLPLFGNCLSMSFLYVFTSLCVRVSYSCNSTFFVPWWQSVYLSPLSSVPVCACQSPQQPASGTLLSQVAEAVAVGDWLPAHLALINYHVRAGEGREGTGKGRGGGKGGRGRKEVVNHSRGRW